MVNQEGDADDESAQPLDPDHVNGDADGDPNQAASPFG
jgi:hypothetical protein